jgi:hypothetical protein
MLAVSGVDPDDPISGTPQVDDDSSSTNTLACPALTTDMDDALAVWGWAATPYQSGSQDDLWSATVSSTDGTVRTTSCDYQAQLVAWDERPTAGSTGTRTATFSNTSGSPVGKTTVGFALNGVQASGAPVTIELDTIFTVGSVQPLTIISGDPPPEPPRTNPITSVERAELLEATHVAYDLAQMLVLDENDNPIGDIADQVTACKIVHDNFRDIHGTIDLSTHAELAWGRDRVQPWLRIEGGGWVDEVALGVFCVTAPEPTGGRTPQTFDVQGYDKLYLLDQQISSPVSLPAGEPILGAVRNILAQQGFGGDRIDATRGADVLVEARTWPLENGRVTYLSIVNDLLSMVGYQPVSACSHGHAHSVPSVPPTERPATWRYDSASMSTIVLADGQRMVDDFTNRPNRWVFWMVNTERETPPTPGDGLFEFDNVSDGRSSQQARGGLAVTRAEGLEAATHDDLEQQALRLIAEDMHSSTELSFTTRLNPYHGHKDVLEVMSTDFGIVSMVEHSVYTHDLFTRRTEHTVRTLAGGIYA